MDFAFAVLAGIYLDGIVFIAVMRWRNRKLDGEQLHWALVLVWPFVVLYMAAERALNR